MKHLRRILSVILVLAVFAGSFVGSRYLFDRGNYGFDVKQLAVFEDDPSRYYLQKADRDIIFRVRCEDGAKLGYSLSDSDGKEVVTEPKKAGGGCYDILPPADGYKEGARYTLSLPKGVSFESEELKDARTLVFGIEKDEIGRYEFTDAVTEVDSVIGKVTDGRLDITGMNAAAGDIIFGKDADGNYAAYKITEINGDGTASVTDPALDELYSDLEAYGEYVWDVNDIILNPDIEIEIKENIKKSSFFNSLMLTAYADDRPGDGALEVELTPDFANNSVTAKITIKLLPGEKGLFGFSELRHHQVTIVLTAEFGVTTRHNIQRINDWDLSTTMTSSFSWNVDFSICSGDSFEKEDGLEGLLSKGSKFTDLIDYQKKARRIIEKLDGLAADATAGELKLFDWKLPVPSVPGLYFSAEIMLFAKLELAAGISVGQSCGSAVTAGICFTNGEFRTYYNKSTFGKDASLSVRGKAEAKAGVKLVLQATLISEGIAYINIDPQIGLYADLYVTYPVSDISEISDGNFIYSYFEPGIYISASVNALLNIGIKKYDISLKLFELKFPMKSFVFGNDKLALGLYVNANTVHALDRTVAVPDIFFRYYDVKAGMTAVDKIPAGDLRFTSADGSRLTVSGGKVTLPDTSVSGSTFITASYPHTDGKTYSTTFRVLVSGSVIEGKVSSFGAGDTTEEIENATVKLFSGTNTGAPIATAMSDENGKFSFNVSGGSYTLEISAGGYRTLVSNQTVGEDEIKYTEHILLMDITQTGMGTAGGTVKNALDGRGISGATIRLRPDWNNTDGAYTDFVTTTDSSGYYTVGSVPVGYYTVEASFDGFVTGYTNIIVLSENGKTDFDFTITPTLNEDEIRIVLTWGQTPRDLDSHLIGRTPSDGTFNVYYSNKVYRYNGTEMANLDVDDTTSYGPETVTILEDIHGTYIYAVHDYSNGHLTNSTEMSMSGAVVRVFIGSVEVASYNIPTDRVGTYWTVFEISEGGRIRPVNTVSNTKPEA